MEMKLVASVSTERSLTHACDMSSLGEASSSRQLLLIQNSSLGTVRRREPAHLRMVGEDLVQSFSQRGRTALRCQYRYEVIDGSQVQLQRSTSSQRRCTCYILGSDSKGVGEPYLYSTEEGVLSPLLPYISTPWYIPVFHQSFIPAVVPVVTRTPGCVGRAGLAGRRRCT